MRLPRDLSGAELAAQLARYGYVISRQEGSHLRLTTTFNGNLHPITVPRHKALKVGTLSSILTEVANYLEIGREELARELFG